MKLSPWTFSLFCLSRNFSLNMLSSQDRTPKSGSMEGMRKKGCKWMHGAGSFHSFCMSRLGTNRGSYLPVSCYLWIVSVAGSLSSHGMAALSDPSPMCTLSSPLGSYDKIRVDFPVLSDIHQTLWSQQWPRREGEIPPSHVSKFSTCKQGLLEVSLLRYAATTV